MNSKKAESLTVEMYRKICPIKCPFLNLKEMIKKIDF